MLLPIIVQRDVQQRVSTTITTHDDGSRECDSRGVVRNASVEFLATSKLRSIINL
jgi:hypothetical protein